MHFAFIPYGTRLDVELLFRDMEAQKLLMACRKKGEKDKGVYINGQVRVLPFGVVEYVFPREFRDVVVHTMTDNKAPNRYGKPKFLVGMFRRALKLSSLPKEYKKDQKFLWQIDNVSIMPIGIREDSELVETKEGEFKGWTHESI